MKLVLRLRRFVGNTRYRTRRFTVEGKVRWIVPPQRSLTLKITPNFVTSKGFIFSRRSVSSESFPSASARARVRLSRGTVFSTLNALRGFFLWLATQPGYRSHLTPADAEYFALADKEARIAKTALQRPVPTIEQIRHVLESMPAETDVDLRNRAVVAFTLLTGARDGAIASLKLKHIDIVG